MKQSVVVTALDAQIAELHSIIDEHIRGDPSGYKVPTVAPPQTHTQHAHSSASASTQHQRTRRASTCKLQAQRADYRLLHYGEADPILLGAVWDYAPPRARDAFPEVAAPQKQGPSPLLRRAPRFPPR